MYRYIHIHVCVYIYSYTVVLVHTMFMRVLCLKLLAPNRRIPRRQEHIKDVIESTTGPTSKWCKDVARLLKCHLAGRESQESFRFPPMNRGSNGEIMYKW